jgi:hypothetical protein
MMRLLDIEETEYDAYSSWHRQQQEKRAEMREELLSLPQPKGDTAYAFVTLPEVIEMVGRGEQYVLRQIQKGNLITPSNVDGEWIFTKTAVDRFLEDLPDEEPELEDIFEEDIPLADVPKTGETMIYRIMAAISGITLMALAVTGRKKEEEEMA